jgi:hypothetical protein
LNSSSFCLFFSFSLFIFSCFPNFEPDSHNFHFNDPELFLKIHPTFIFVLFLFKNNSPRSANFDLNFKYLLLFLFYFLKYAFFPPKHPKPISTNSPNLLNLPISSVHHHPPSHLSFSNNFSHFFSLLTSFRSLQQC